MSASKKLDSIVQSMSLRPKRRSKQTPEGQVLSAVCDYLAILQKQGRLMFWRQNNGATWDPVKRIHRKPNGPGHRSGVPDIALVTHSGRFVGLEVKRSDGGAISKEQKQFRQDVEALGGVFAVVRSVEDVQAALLRAASTTINEGAELCSNKKTV